MRYYKDIDKHLDSLQGDIHHQPDDAGHTAWAKSFVNKVLRKDVDDSLGIKSVIDIGCGIGFCRPLFENRGITWCGTTMNAEDITVAAKNGAGITFGDMLSIDFLDNSFDMVLSRHVLEHSPAPLLSLMEYRRVAKKYLALVLPTPEYWGYGGRNHYSVMGKEQLSWLLKRSGWEVIFESTMTTMDTLFMEFYMPEKDMRDKVFPDPQKVVEYQMLCEAVEEITE